MSAPLHPLFSRVTARTAACLASLSCTACAGPQDFMRAANPAAREVASFGWWVLLVFCLAAAIVWLVLAWLALRYDDGSFAAHAPADEDQPKRWIVIGGLGIPAVVFITFFFLMFAPMQGSTAHQATGGRADIRVIGRQWWFEARYLGERPDQAVSVPSELHIPVGRPIDIELETRDVIHSFWIPKLHGKVDLVPGRVNHVQLLADTPGTYRGECGEFCGAQHAHMRIDIVAEPPAYFDAWLENQRAPASQADADEQARHGHDVFMSAACALCHTIRGTAARGTIGPDLTHVGSRKRIAGGSFENTTANLSAWIVDAQSMKPGARMPSLRQLPGPDQRALVAYLQSLR